MERNNLFTDFQYKLFFSPLRKKECVEVSFIYDHKLIKRYIFIDKASNVDYIQEAKRIIKIEIENGQLEQYAKRYGRNLKPLFITIATTLAVAVIAGTGYLGYKYLSSGGGGYKPGDVVDVIVDAKDQQGTSHTLTLTKTSATVGQKYESDIKLSNQDIATYTLPNALESITSDNKPIQSGEAGYTYSLIAPNVAHISIIESCVVGPINMKLTLLTNTTKPIMSVDQIDHCEIYYINDGQKQKLEVGKQLEVKLGTIEFECKLEEGYQLDNDCFTLIDTNHQPLEHTYANNKLTVTVTSSFSFKAQAVSPQPTYEATVTYNNKCTGVYISTPQGETKIESGASVPVTLKEGNKLEFAVDVASGISLTSQEVTCSLVGVIVTVDKTPTLTHPYLITLDCSSCSMSNFSLDIHPGILSPVNVTATWTNCVSVKDASGKELTSGAPQAISPIKQLEEVNPLIALTVAVSDGELAATDITGLVTLTNPEIKVFKSYELSNVYEVQIICANFVDFSVNINPHIPGPTVDVTVTFTDKCTVFYNEQQITSGSTIDAAIEQDSDLYWVTFKVITTDNLPLTVNNAWTDRYNVSIEPYQEGGLNNYLAKVVYNSVLTDPINLEIRPGEIKSTLVFNDNVSVLFDEQEITSNTPFFVEAPNADAKIQFDVKVEEGYYITNDCISFDKTDCFDVNVDLDVPWDYTVEVSLKDSKKEQGWVGFTMTINEQPVAAIDITIDANAAITGMDVRINDEPVEITDWKLEDFTPENQYTDFIVYTDGTELTNADVSVDLTLGICSVNRIADGTFGLAVSVPSVDLWDDYTISIKPSLDLPIATKADPTGNHYSISRAGTPLSESPTDITYTKGTYTYAYDVTFDQYYTFDECAVYYTVGESSPVPIAQESISFENNQLIVTFPENTFKDITLIDIQITAKWNTTVTMHVTYNTTDFELLDASRASIATDTDVDITEPVTTLYLHVLNENLLPDFDPTSGIPRYFIEITGDATFTIDSLVGETGYFEVKVTTSPSVSGFTITIVNPAVLILNDESKGTFADYRLKERMNENFGKTTHAFDFYPGTYDYDHEITLISASDPELQITSYVYEPYASMGYGSITFNKQITQGMRVTIDINPIY